MGMKDQLRGWEEAAAAAAAEVGEKKTINGKLDVGGWEKAQG